MQRAKLLPRLYLGCSLVNNPGDYKYSSYLFYAGGKKDALVTEDFFYRSLGKTVEVRQTRYEKMIIDEVVEETYKKKVWGSREQRYNEHRKTKYNLNKD